MSKKTNNVQINRLKRKNLQYKKKLNCESGKIAFSTQTKIKHSHSHSHTHILIRWQNSRKWKVRIWSGPVSILKCFFSRSDEWKTLFRKRLSTGVDRGYDTCLVLMKITYFRTSLGKILSFSQYCILTLRN